MPEAIKHEQGPPQERPSHRVRLLDSTRLSQIAGDADAIVNSHHHQAVESVGADLIATAWTTDGVIEAMEDPRPDRFVLGVQWHPELGWRNDGLSQRLFQAFVNEAAEPRREQNTRAERQATLS